jgi:hypothetical protein
MLLLAALPLALAAGAEAAPHTLVVRITDQGRVYSHAMEVEDQRHASFTGKPDEGGDRDMTVNAVVARAGAKAGVELQVELAHADRSRSIQLRTSLEMREGQRLTAAECGVWKVEVVLDGKPGRAAPARAAWSSEGLDDYRLTLELAAAAARLRCRQVLREGAQSSIVEATSKNGRREGFFLNAILTKSRSGGFDLQYQLQKSALEVQSRTALALGIRSTAPAGDGKIDFLLEGAPPAAAPASQSPAESGAVPLLR